MTRVRHIAPLLLLCACADNPARFALPRNIEDMRARMLAAIPEGRDIEGARTWMREQGFPCEAPLPSATDAHATVCRVPARGWTIVLIEKNGRLQDVQSRMGTP